MLNTLTMEALMTIIYVKKKKKKKKSQIKLNICEHHSLNQVVSIVYPSTL